MKTGVGTFFDCLLSGYFESLRSDRPLKSQSQSTGRQEHLLFPVKQMNRCETHLLVTTGVRLLRRKLRSGTTVVLERRRGQVSAVGPAPSWGWSGRGLSEKDIVR